MITSIGPYEILDRLGSGGMGEVFKARDPATGRLVAVKRLKGEPEDVGLRLRFRREIRVMSRLRHPNIVRVLDHGVVGGEPYFAMEFIQGETLDQQFQLGPDRDAAEPDRVRRVVEAILQIGHALAYLHSERITHRDLKPGNLMILPDGMTKLMDFGLVKEQGVDDGSGEGISMVGSMYYLSPEAATAGPTDGRSDLFSLGVILYELFTGRRPFEGDSLFAVLLKITQHSPLPMTEVNQALPEELDRMVCRLLEKDPADRYQNAEELVAELDHWLQQDGTRPAEVPAEPLRPGSYLLQPRFVAREGPLTILLNRVGDPENPGTILGLAGGPGIGKTRLLKELVTRGRSRGMRIFMGRCTAGTVVPLEPFHRIGPSLARLFATFSVDRFARVVGPDAGIVGRMLRRAERPLPLSSGFQLAETVFLDKDLQDRTFEALAGIFRRLALEEPVMILVDDAHQADRETLEILGHIVRTASIQGFDSAAAPLAVAMSYQPAEVIGNPALVSLLDRLRRNERLKEIHLAPLGPTDTADMVRSMLGQRALPEGLAERIQGETQGNPFYIREILSTLVDNGNLHRAGQDWRLRDSSEELPIPESIREVVRERISALEPEGRKALEWIAVAGPQVAFPILRGAMGIGEDGLLDLLDGLLRRRLLQESRRGGTMYIRFVDEKVREVIYQGLAPTPRRQAHSAVARALEERTGAALETAEELARHLTAAGDPVRALRYLLAAGDRVINEAGYARAAAYYSAAERILGSSGITSEAARHAQDRLLLGRARANRILGESSEALRDLRRLKRRATRRGERVLMGRALLEIGMVQRNVGQLDDSAASLVQAVEILGASGSPEEHRRALLDLASTRRSQGRLEESNRLAQKVLVLYREAGDLAGSAKTLSLLGTLALAAGDQDRAEPLLWEALEAYREANHRGGAAKVLTQLGTLAWDRGDFRSAVDCYSEALPITSKVGSRASQGRLVLSLGEVHLEEGDFERALLHIEEALEIFGRSGDRQGEALCLVALARLQLLRDKARNAFLTCQQARTIQKETGDRSLYTRILLLQGQVHGALGRPAEELSTLTEAQRIATATGETRLLVEIHLACAHAQLRAHNLDWAGREAQRALEAAQGARYGSIYWRIQAVLHRVAEEKGREDEAEAHLKEAALALWSIYDNLTDDRAREALLQLPEVARFLEKSELSLGDR